MSPFLFAFATVVLGALAMLITFCWSARQRIKSITLTLRSRLVATVEFYEPEERHRRPR